MASCNSRRRFAAPGRSSVADDGATPLPVATLATAVGGVPGVLSAGVELGQVVARVRTDALVPVMLTLRDDPRFACEQLMDLCGVDWPERAERFEVVYNLLSVSCNQRVRVIVATDGATPVPSVCGVWPVATWWEREAWDLYGIVVSGQADLRRILTDYGFEGHPMRKDFPLSGYVQVRYDEERKQVVYEPVKLTHDFRNFDFLSPWEAITSLPGDEKAYAAR